MFSASTSTHALFGPYYNPTQDRFGAGVWNLSLDLEKLSRERHLVVQRRAYRHIKNTQTETTKA